MINNSLSFSGLDLADWLIPINWVATSNLGLAVSIASRHWGYIPCQRATGIFHDYLLSYGNYLEEDLTLNNIKQNSKSAPLGLQIEKPYSTIEPSYLTSPWSQYQTLSMYFHGTELYLYFYLLLTEHHHLYFVHMCILSLLSIITSHIFI